MHDQYVYTSNLTSKLLVYLKFSQCVSTEQLCCTCFTTQLFFHIVHSGIGIPSGHLHVPGPLPTHVLFIRYGNSGTDSDSDAGQPYIK